MARKKLAKTKFQEQQERMQFLLSKLSQAHSANMSQTIIDQIYDQIEKLKFEMQEDALRANLERQFKDDGKGDDLIAK